MRRAVDAASCRIRFAGVVGLYAEGVEPASPGFPGFAAYLGLRIANKAVNPERVQQERPMCWNLRRRWVNVRARRTQRDNLTHRLIGTTSIGERLRTAPGKRMHPRHPAASPRRPAFSADPIVRYGAFWSERTHAPASQ